MTANNAAPGADDADSEQAGRIVVLNGPPRSGKSSIADVIQATFDGPWLNLGADVFSQFVTPPRLRPGIGLRPGGGERPDIEELIPALYAAFYDSVAAHKRRNTGQPGREGRYRTSGPAARSPSRCAAGSGRSTSPGVYDLEIDTSAVTPETAAAMIRERLAGPAPSAFRELARDPATGDRR